LGGGICRWLGDLVLDSAVGFCVGGGRFSGSCGVGSVEEEECCGGGCDGGGEEFTSAFTGGGGGCWEDWCCIGSTSSVIDAQCFWD